MLVKIGEPLTRGGALKMKCGQDVYYKNVHMLTLQLLLVEEDPRVRPRDVFQTMTGTWIEPPTFRKTAR